MKFKRIILITLLLTIFTISAVSAADENATNEVISIENNNAATDTIDLDEKSTEDATDNDEVLGLNEKSNETTLTNNNNEDNILSSDDVDELEDTDTRKITAKSIKAYSNKKFTYTVKLTDNNTPVSGETIELTIFDSNDNDVYYTAKTNSNGIATFKIGPQSKGKYMAYIETYDLFEEKYITVIQNPKTKTTVKAPGVTAKYKQNKYFEVTVKNYQGKPIKNLKLTLKVLNNHKYTYYKIKTNSKGIAKFNTKKLKAGNNIVYIYNPDKKYDISKKSKISIKATHYVKVEKYKGKLTNKQYTYLVKSYKKDKNFAHVTIKCTNVKYHKITVEILTGYNPMNDKYYKKGFYASVWDTRYGIDGTKISNKKAKLYLK